MTQPTLEHTPELMPSFDGTSIAARRMGAGGGTPLLVVNAVGATLAIWRRALAASAGERPILTWDHRGLHASKSPESDRNTAGTHAEDAVAVLDRFDIEKVAIASWSNGTRIALEITSRYPERVVSLVTVCGAYGYSLRRLVRHLHLPSVLPLAAGVGKHFASYIEGPVRALAARPELAGFIRQSGFVGPTADTAALVDLLRDMAQCDPKRFLAAYEAVAGDSAPDLLREVDVPALVVAGDRDTFVPLPISQKIARLIPSSRLEVYERATHFLPIEFPARLSDDLRAFWEELGH
ncbi:MAG: alpha/beta hydrolase [Actinomycetota bacterium]|nr:alpha/beta hydrolase [Actinomycetota bacterium]